MKIEVTRLTIWEGEKVIIFNILAVEDINVGDLYDGLRALTWPVSPTERTFLHVLEGLDLFFSLIRVYNDISQAIEFTIAPLPNKRPSCPE